jgi:hypothetical protein
MAYTYSEHDIYLVNMAYTYSEDDIYLQWTWHILTVNMAYTYSEHDIYLQNSNCSSVTEGIKAIPNLCDQLNKNSIFFSLVYSFFFNVFNSNFILSSLHFFISEKTTF